MTAVACCFMHVDSWRGTSQRRLPTFHSLSRSPASNSSATTAGLGRSRQLHEWDCEREKRGEILCVNHMQDASHLRSGSRRDDDEGKA